MSPDLFNRQPGYQHETEDQNIINTQLDFYKKGRAGCLFAAHAATNPDRYGWQLSVATPEKDKIEVLVRSATSLDHISTQSIIFPNVTSADDLKLLLSVLKDVNSCTLEQQEEFLGQICLGYRMHIGTLTSWVTGFGNYDFLPPTRRAPYTEITFRSKPRPNYKHVMKQAPEGVIHLADMDMKGMSKTQFFALWHGSFKNTEKIIGHKPDLRSAAKTTFAVPKELWLD